MSKMTEGPNWDRLTKELRDAPLSWVPALCLLGLELACARKVFASREVMKMVVNRQIDKYWKE
jgi:hypothetical protein